MFVPSRHLSGCHEENLTPRFSSNEAITFVNKYFAEKDTKDYVDELKRWGHRWEKWVARRLRGKI